MFNPVLVAKRDQKGMPGTCFLSWRLSKAFWRDIYIYILVLGVKHWFTNDAYF